MDQGWTLMRGAESWREHRLPIIPWCFAQMIRQDQRLLQTVGIVVSEAASIELGVCGVDDPVMVGAQDDDIAAHIWSAVA